ncbi:multidrug resistance-associated protein 1 [Akanthomyces lecanii RCEF 1005]|uniref:Multidrug resistance-associated protein 1 n=1 Tax=Akanthomyces lecanii RCEF 1005 TaxID=1081108 RepID=A0A167YKQ6_CORDF|nr:multidrug resistance-associated protein 1 [Akanthomyces lecanii RCEF 1005]
MLAGVALMIVLSPVHGLVVVFYKRFQVRYMKAKDNRTRLMGGIIDNMKAIKLYAWDSVYQEKLRCVRHDEELKAMQIQSILAGSFTILFSMPRYLITALSFGIYVLIQSKPLTTDIVFTSLAVFNMLRSPLSQLPNLVSTMTEGAVSLHRCVEIFTAEELQPDAVIIEAKPASPSGGLIIVKDAAFTPGSSESKELISIPDFLCHQNEFCCIIGSVGSGKSSFLSGILGQLHKTKGTVKLRGTVAYVPQTSWIMNGSIKENILLGSAWNSVLYEQTLNACALRPDLKTLPEGDATEVGERGISVSGGQKARISLARAVYSQADIYIIDDCLAAVDEHVGKHLIQQVLGPHGILRNQARILTTNSTRVLRSADTIYYLQEGQIAEQGTYQKLMSTETETFKLVNTHLKKQESERTTSGTETSLITIEAERSSSATPLSVDTKHDLDVADIKEGLAEVQAAQATTPAAMPDFITDEVLDDVTEATPLLADNRQKETASDTNAEDGSGQLAKGKLETSERGKVTIAVYKAYTSACGHFQLAAWVCFMMLSHAAALSSGLWIRYWTDKNAKYGGNYQPGQFIAIYTALGLASALCGAATSIVVNAFCRISASKKLHDNMAAAMFRAPLSFFETTPAGQILNRFGSDMSRIDGEMIGTFTQALSCLTSIMFTLAVVCWTSPFFLIFVGPLAYICVVLQQYYVRTSRELSRMDSSTKSPIYSHFQESLGGVNTILAYRKQDIFEKETKTRIDNNLQAYFLSFYSNRWITLRVEFLGSVIVGGVAAFAIAAMATGHPVDPGAVGLALSYALEITTDLMYTVKTSSQIENSLVAVERVLEYTAIPPEAPLESSPSTAPLPSWPTAGAIEFQHYSTRYRPGLPFVLEDLNLSIPAGARVGIVGRTGAGKSTLALALFRIIEPAEGAIAIDNVDTTCIGLNDLRPRLSIILQDPAIFPGTVRDNLDPASVHTDEELWSALAQAQLKAHVESMEGGIHATLHERGSNLSQGQRQLISLARALLTSARVLVLDEATSAVDHRTDAIVQETLRGKKFQNKTILTVAHRINTIADSDYIVVLEQGRALEIDTPQALVEKGGLFRDLVVEAGLLGHFNWNMKMHTGRVD